MMKKTNAKRILAAALAGMMALSLSACGEQGGRLSHRRRNHRKRIHSSCGSGDKSGSRVSGRATRFRENR